MNDKQQREKRAYTKPELIQVQLRPDEAVLGNCKTTAGSTGGPGSGNCRTPSNCSSLGS